MFTDRIFVNIKNEINDFNNLIEKFMITSSQLNANEDYINLYSNYDFNLRNITMNLLECEKNERNFDKCINEYKDTFYKLRSETSINLEKQVKKI